MDSNESGPRSTWLIPRADRNQVTSATRRTLTRSRRAGSVLESPYFMVSSPTVIVNYLTCSSYIAHAGSAAALSGLSVNDQHLRRHTEAGGCVHGRDRV